MKQWLRAHPAAQIGLVVLVALILRLLYWKGYGQAEIGYIDADARNYYANARTLGSDWSLFLTSLDWHRWYGWIKAPLYYVFLAVGGMLTRFSVPGMRLFQILVDAGTVLIAYGLARELSGHRAGLVAAVAYAVYFEFVILPCSLISEVLFLPLLGGTLWLLLRAGRKDSLPLTIGAGALAGATALCRPVILPFMPLAAVWLVTVQIKAHVRPLRSLSHVMLLAAFTGLLTVPWMARNSRLIGRPFALDNMAKLNIVLSHAFPEMEELGIGLSRHIENERVWEWILWHVPSTRLEYPLTVTRILQVTFEPSMPNARMIVNKAEQIVRPRLTRLFLNYPPHMRYPRTPPTAAVAVASDVLFLVASIFIVIGCALKADRRNALLLAWILLQMFFLTVIFRPTPNYHIRRYSLPFMFASLPFIYPGLCSLRTSFTKGRLALAAVVLSVWVLLVLCPLIRWGYKPEMWTRKGLEILCTKEAT